MVELRSQSQHPASSLLSKQGLVITRLAADLLECGEGDRIKRVQEYAQSLDASVGTVQSALQHLQRASAARFEGHGRLGTFVHDLQYPLLWSLALGRPIVGAMPLPYSRRFAGLAMGVRQQFARQPLSLDLRFMRGANNRLQALSSRACDWALMSRFAAETAGAHGFATDIVVCLGPDTYMAHHVLLFGHREATRIEDGMRVGVDLQSTDHTFLMRALCRGKQVRFVEIGYSQGLSLLMRDQIDVTVWSQEDVPANTAGIAAQPLDLLAEPVAARLSEAALVVSQGHRPAANVLLATLDGAALLQAQRDVVDLVRLPAY